MVSAAHQPQVVATYRAPSTDNYYARTEVTPLTASAPPMPGYTEKYSGSQPLQSGGDSGVTTVRYEVLTQSPASEQVGFGALCACWWCE